jgi:hypothetical protein
MPSTVQDNMRVVKRVIFAYCRSAWTLPRRRERKLVMKRPVSALPLLLVLVAADPARGADRYFLSAGASWNDANN